MAIGYKVSFLIYWLGQPGIYETSNDRTVKDKFEKTCVYYDFLHITCGCFSVTDLII